MSGWLSVCGGPRTQDLAQAIPVPQATRQQPFEVKVVDADHYWDNDLRRAIYWRQLNNGSIQYQIPDLLLHEYEDPKAWVGEYEFTDRTEAAATSRADVERGRQHQRNRLEEKIRPHAGLID
jgi:hypothetical protein